MENKAIDLLDKIGVMDIKLVDSNECTISYLDFQMDSVVDDNEEHTGWSSNLERVIDQSTTARKMSIVPIFKDVVLDDDISDYNTMFGEYINKVLSIVTDDCKVTYTIDPTISNDSQLRRLTTKLGICCHLILAKSRLGGGHFAITSERNSEFLSPDHGFRIIVDDRVGDTIIVGRKNNIDQPGINLVANLTDNKYKIFESGFYPNYNFATITVVR